MNYTISLSFSLSLSGNPFSELCIFDGRSKFRPVLSSLLLMGGLYRVY